MDTSFIDRMYEDFTTKVLPTIQDGLVITKDYFVDLFGRYVKYLIAIDVMWVLIGIGMFFLGRWLRLKAYKIWRDATDDSDYDTQAFGGIGVGLMIGLQFAGFCVAVLNIRDVAGDVFVPEIRVYEEIKSLNDGCSGENK